MAVKTKAPKPVIKAATIATVLEKVTNKILGFLVKSNSSDQYYQIQLEVISGQHEFFCTCEAKDWGCSECAHIKAILQVLEAKAELEQAKAEAALETAETIASVKAEITTIETTSVETEQTPLEVAQTAMMQAAEQHISQPVVAAPQFVNPPMTFEARMQQLEEQRAYAAKHGGFSILK